MATYITLATNFGLCPVTETKTCLISRICSAEYQTSILITGLVLV